MRIPFVERILRSALAATLCCTAALLSHAQTTSPAQREPSAAIKFVDALDSAWRRATQEREAQGRTSKASAAQQVAASPWAGPPALELSHRNDRFQSNGALRETEVGLAWPLWLPGQRAAYRAAADAETELAGAAVSAGRLHVAGRLRLAWSEVTSARADIDANERQARYLDALMKDVQRRVGAGDLAPADGLAADAEALGAASSLSQARQRLAEASSRWRLLTGLGVPASLEDIASAPPADLSGHPDIVFARLDAERARRRFSAVSRDTRDPPELTVRVRQDVGGPGASAQYSLGVGVRIPFATASRNAPLTAVAQEDLALAEHRLDRLLESLPAQQALARQALAEAENLLGAERDRATKLTERARLIGISFSAGETPLPENLRATAAAAQGQLSFMRQQVAVEVARANLLQSLGVLP